MSYHLARVADPTYVAENRLPPRSDHRCFRSTEEAEAGSSSLERCLNGLWRLHHAASPAEVLPGWEQPDVDTSGWDEIPVPGHLQLHGYGRPQYVNVQYPWDGLEDVRPGQVPTRDNQVASYRTTFALDEPLAPGERLTVVFHGAESTVAVWLNGTWIGYGTDSFTPSEFDLTPALVPGENALAVQVVRFSAASWIEDQDFFRFSGLFRDVVLHRRPATHLADLRVRTDVAADLGTARVRLDTTLTGPGSVRATLAGEGELADLGDGTLAIDLTAPRLWSAEDPHLYDLWIEVLDADGAVSEVVPQRVGVRRFGIEDGVLRINGQRIVFRGVNRHEFGPEGRVMSAEQIEADIRLIKAAGINAVRTSHYPNSSVFYDLCDRYGLYVVDEMNLESHGLWNKVERGELPVADAVPGDRPEWRATLLDRAASMLERDKNHPCVVMWSCGNESFGGSNIAAVGDWFRAADTRPVHYEGVYWDPRHPDTSDVVSRMYPPAAEIEQYLATHRDKPYLLCEYAHSMGNSFGAVDRYLDLTEREPLFQGGFIWDFADQTLVTTDRHGRPYAGYGGDFGDRPTDYEFSANGIVFADRSPTPAMQEVRYLYQPLRIAITDATIEIHNRQLFTGTGHLDCVVLLAREGETLRETGLETDVAPGTTRSYPLPVEVPGTPGEYTIDVSFRLAEPTAWAPAGHEVAWQQVVRTVEGAPPVRATAGAPEVVVSTHNVGVRGEHFTALFSRLHGGPVSYRFGPTGRELLTDLPYPSFWHAPTSNERGWGMPFRDGPWLLASRYRRPRPGLPCPAVEVGQHAVELRYAYQLPTSPAGECDVTYRVDADGRVDVTVDLRPGHGLSDPPELAMTLTVPADLHRLRWYGEGPAECYVDRRNGARLGVYQAEVADQLTPYARPQESGSHTGVRWATVTDDQGAGLRLDCPEGMELSALPWTPFEVENARHRVDLPPVQHTVLRPALQRRGVGGDDSWGAEPHPEYRLPAGHLTFRFGFQGLA